jgi:hypothetical protein
VKWAPQACTDAIACPLPRCAAEPGEPCLTDRPLHLERWDAWAAVNFAERQDERLLDLPPRNPIGVLPTPRLTVSMVFDCGRFARAVIADEYVERKPRAVGKCTACGSSDHNRKNKRCPGRSALRRALDEVKS